MAFLIVAAGAAFLWHKLNLASRQPVLSIGSAAVKIAVADTPVKRQQGLSGRKSLRPDEGLFFIFNQPGFYPFWMKEMNFSIDIIWLDENKKIVDIDKNIPPQSFPQLFQSRRPVQYVLEVNAGFANRHQIGIGQQAQFFK